LTGLDVVVIISNMKAKQIFNRRVVITKDSFAEFVIWEVPEPLAGSTHSYNTYRMAFVHCGISVLRHDNGTGKGDHKHIGVDKKPYIFKDVKTLIQDFVEDIRRWRNEHADP
jgi:hypothetical protein